MSCTPSPTALCSRLEQLEPLGEDVVDAAVAGEVLLGLEGLLAVAETKEVPLVDVEAHDLLEELVQRLVGVRDDERPLVGEDVVDVGL